MFPTMESVLFLILMLKCPINFFYIFYSSGLHGSDDGHQNQDHVDLGTHRILVEKVAKALQPPPRDFDPMTDEMADRQRMTYRNRGFRWFY